MNQLRRLALRALGTLAFTGSLVGLGAIVVDDATAGERAPAVEPQKAANPAPAAPAPAPAPQAAAATRPPAPAPTADEMKEPVAAPAPKAVKKRKKRVSFGRYEGY